MKNCVICKQDIKPNAIGWEHGNYAQPVAEGQCCDECNIRVVVPARLQKHYAGMTISEAMELSTQLEDERDMTGQDDCDGSTPSPDMPRHEY